MLVQSLCQLPMSIWGLLWLGTLYYRPCRNFRWAPRSSFYLFFCEFGVRVWSIGCTVIGMVLFPDLLFYFVVSACSCFGAVCHGRCVGGEKGRGGARQPGALSPLEVGLACIGNGCVSVEDCVCPLAIAPARCMGHVPPMRGSYVFRVRDDRFMCARYVYFGVMSLWITVLGGVGMTTVEDRPKVKGPIFRIARSPPFSHPRVMTHYYPRENYVVPPRVRLVSRRSTVRPTTPPNEGDAFRFVPSASFRVGLICFVEVDFFSCDSSRHVRTIVMGREDRISHLYLSMAVQADISSPTAAWVFPTYEGPPGRCGNLNGKSDRIRSEGGNKHSLLAAASYDG